MAAVHRQTQRMAAHPWSASHRFISLFIGGGTPTVYDSDTLCRLIDECLQNFSLASDAEITIEANPDTVDLRKLRRLHAAGVNRISIGVQSFEDHVLAAIGRCHTAKQAKRAVLAAGQAGFANISLDLIFGLPGQDENMHEKSIETAIALGVRHLSVYELMVEKNSRLPTLIQEKKLSLPDEKTTVAMMKKTARLLKEAGFDRYEISNYARKGFKCRHNLNYWQNGSYLGLGAGAVSCFSGLRLATDADPDSYAAAVNKDAYPYTEGEALSEAASRRETMIMGLRMTGGVNLADFRKGYPAELLPDYLATIGRLCREGLLVRKGDSLRLSARGLMLANRVLSELV